MIELLALALLLVGGLVLGLLFGHAGWFIAAALVVYVARCLWQLYRLERWLDVGRRRNPPESWGVWGEVFEHYYKLLRRYYKRKKRLAKVIREFRESTAAMPDGTVVLDVDFSILWFNKAARYQLGLAGNADLGQPITNLLRSPKFRDYLSSGQYEQGQVISSPVSDQRYLSVRLIPYGKNQYLLMARDITRLQRLQAMRRDFVANASHELRSPLTVLNGYVESLVDDPTLANEWAKPLAEMQAQCRRMSNLVNDLLELSRLETEEPDADIESVVDVPALIRRIVGDARSQDRQQHLIACQLDGQVGLAGVENELHSALANLVLNAIRYTPAGGQIGVRWYHDTDNGAVFEVSDTGIGIDEKHIPFITQRFYRVDSGRSRSVGGTGLGLAIVKHVLQRHDGSLEVESEPGVGSTFRCLFGDRRVRHLPS